MDVRKSLHDALVVAMKEKNEFAKTALRGAIDAINKAEVSGKQRVELNEGQARDVLRKLTKAYRSNADEYERAGAPDRAEKERNEADLIDTFLPSQLDEAATRALVESVVNENGLAGSGKKSIGTIRGILSSRDDVDLALVAKIASQLV